MQTADKDRLAKVLAVIENLKLRFPVSDLAKNMQVDKGVVSSYLNGKKPISDNFYTKFMQHYGSMEGANKKETKEPTSGETIAALQAAVKVLTLELVSLKHQVTKESITKISLDLEKMMQQEAIRLTSE